MSKNTSKNRKKWIWIGVGTAALIVVGILAAPLLFPDMIPAGAPIASATTGETVTAFTGSLSANATASGQIEAQRAARLAMAASGEVSQIFVAVGDEVAEGAPLLQLETDALARAVENARQTLIIQEANLAALLAPPTTANLAALEAAVASAQAQLDNLLAGPGEYDIAASDANVRAAQANVRAASEQLQLAQSGASGAEVAAAQAELLGALSQQESTQDLYDKLVECFDVDLPDGSNFNICPGLGNPEEQTRYSLETANANAAAAQARLNALLDGPDSNAVAIAQASLAAANANLAAAQANHDLLLKGATAAQIASAEASVAQAQANLEALRNGPSVAQRAMAEIAVAQARISLQKAEQDLADATLTAPFAGVITAVLVNEGETASGILMEIVDGSSLEVALAVDEVDIGDISLDQPAAVTLESWPDTVINGRVSSIAPKANQSSSGVVSYQVTLRLEPSDLPVLVGMTANANLLTNSFDNVLLVPNAAINADRSKGTFSVNKVITDASGNQTYEMIPVTIGLRDRENTQILSGLQEGDELLIGNIAPRFDFGPDENGEGGGPPGGGNGGGPFGGG